MSTTRVQSTENTKSNVLLNSPDTFEQRNELQKLEYALSLTIRSTYDSIKDRQIFSTENLITILSHRYKSEILSAAKYCFALDISLSSHNLNDLIKYCDKLNHLRKYLHEDICDGSIEVLEVIAKHFNLNNLIESSMPLFRKYQQEIAGYFACRSVDNNYISKLFYILKSKNLFSDNFTNFIIKQNKKRRNRIKSKSKRLDIINDIIIKDFDQHPDAVLMLFKRYRNLAALISTAALVSLLSKGLYTQEYLEKLIPYFFSLKLIEFFDGGKSIDTWSELAKTVIDRATPPKQRRSRLDHYLYRQNIEITSPMDFANFTKAGWQFLRRQGRTILFKNSDADILAVKILKFDESPYELFKEFHTTNYIRHDYDKRKRSAYVPEPIGLNSFSSLAWLQSEMKSDDYNQLKQMVGEKHKYDAYLYKVDKNHAHYFTYLHNPCLSDEEFKFANIATIDELCDLFVEKIIFHQMADAFHNTEVKDKPRDDLGRYIVLCNLLAPIVLSDGCLRGNGRQHAWKCATEFTNARGTGPSDRGDWCSNFHFMFNGYFTQKYFHNANSYYKEKVGNYLLANTLAEYPYILFLNAGRRGCELQEIAVQENRTQEEIFAIWQCLAQQIIDNCAREVNRLCKMDFAKVRNSLAIITNVNSLARQMQFWMTKEYVKKVQGLVFPAGIYPKHVNTVLDQKRVRPDTFDKEIGCSLDHVHEDLGYVNGQEPIKAANVLLYAMIIMIFISYLEFTLTDEYKNALEIRKKTLSDIKRIRAERHPEKREDLRLNAFLHLSGAQYHATHLAFLKRQVLDDRLTWDQKSEVAKVQAQAEYHSKAYKHLVYSSAAFTIQQAWRKSKNTNNTSHSQERKQPRC